MHSFHLAVTLSKRAPKRLEGIADELENGRGFVLIRGLPVERYSEEDIEAACFGIGFNLGFLCSTKSTWRFTLERL